MKLWKTMWEIAVLVLLVSIAGGTTMERLSFARTLLGIAEGVVVLVWLCRAPGTRTERR